MFPSKVFSNCQFIEPGQGCPQTCFGNNNHVFNTGQIGQLCQCGKMRLIDGGEMIPAQIQ